MLTYKTDRQDIFHYFKQPLLVIALILVPIFYSFVFPTPFIKDAYFPLACGLSIIKIFDEIFKARLVELQFDEEKKQVNFIYKRMFSMVKQKVLLFSNARLEVVRNNIKIPLVVEPVTLYFLHSKKEVFEIMKSKDGFSNNTMQQISDSMENLSLPVTRF
jgi:hypothetical protein